MPSGHEAGSCWRADGAGSVEPREACASSGQAVDVWRLDVLKPVGADLVKSQIVAKNQDDVGSVQWGLRCHRREAKHDLSLALQDALQQDHAWRLVAAEEESWAVIHGSARLIQN